nr:glutamate-cysteine ligase family protein [Salinibaculum sp. KK48]
MPEAKPLRRSIEVEYWVVDDEGYLAEPTGLVDATEGAEREFVEPLLEVKTTPCETTAELREELLGRLGRVLRRAEELDRGLVPLATPVHTEEIADLPSERTDIQDTVVGGDFEYVRHCAGTHVHIEQLPGREVDQLNTLVALDPALALANSSPFFPRSPHRGRRPLEALPLARLRRPRRPGPALALRRRRRRVGRTARTPLREVPTGGHRRRHRRQGRRGTLRPRERRLDARPVPRGVRDRRVALARCHAPE